MQKLRWTTKNLKFLLKVRLKYFYNWSLKCLENILPKEVNSEIVIQN